MLKYSYLIAVRLFSFTFGFMNLQDEVDYRHMSLKDLSNLIDSNVNYAAKFGQRMSWGFTGTTMYGRIFKDDTLIFNKNYTEKHTHVNIAQMHVDFRKHFEGLERVARLAGMQRREKGDSGDWSEKR